MSDKNAQILEAFQKTGKPMRPGEIAEITGIDKDEVSKLLKKMKTSGEIISPKRCFYGLPE